MNGDEFPDLHREMDKNRRILGLCGDKLATV